MMCAFPDASLVALWNDAPAKYPFAHESWLARTPFRKHKALALPLMPRTWRHIVPPSNDVDFALVSSHLFAHHIDVRNASGESVPKFVYAHTPARYIWEPNLDDRGSSPFVHAASLAFRPLDRHRAQEAVRIAANSQYVKDRIRRAWHREASVIYPPVDVSTIMATNDWRERLTGSEAALLESLPAEFLLGASRFVPYKRLDTVIRLAQHIGVPAVIAGSGPQERQLRALAAESDSRIFFVVAPSTPLLYALYQSARAFIFPAVEDFGIMPVEAIAAGCRVVVNGVGGATETVRIAECGGIAETDTLDGFARALEVAESTPVRPSKVGNRFGRSRFVSELQNWVLEAS